MFILFIFFILGCFLFQPWQIVFYFICICSFQPNFACIRQFFLQVKATAVNIEDIMTAVGRRPLVSLTATQENPVVLGQEFSGL